MSAGHLHRRMMGGAPTFASLLAKYTVVEHWPMSSAGPYSSSAGSIPDTYGTSNDTRDNTFRNATSNTTHHYQQTPIATTGTTGCFAITQKTGAEGEQRVDLAEISGTYNCNGTTNPWTFFVFLRLDVTGTITGSQNAGSPLPGGPQVAIKYNWGTGNFDWSAGPTDTGVSLTGGTVMLAWTGGSSTRTGYLFGQGATSSYVDGGSNYTLGAGTSGSYTQLHNAFLNSDASNYVKQSYQDAYIISEKLTQANLQELYDAATG